VDSSFSNPACTNGKNGDDINSQAESDLQEMQLDIVNHGDWKRYAPLLGKRLQVKGTLYHAQTALDRTPVLLTVQLIKASTVGSKK